MLFFLSAQFPSAGQEKLSNARPLGKRNCYNCPALGHTDSLNIDPNTRGEKLVFQHNKIEQTHKSEHVHAARYLETTIKLITTDIKQAVIVIPDGFCSELCCILFV